MIEAKHLFLHSIENHTGLGFLSLSLSLSVLWDIMHICVAGSVIIVAHFALCVFQLAVLDLNSADGQCAGSGRKWFISFSAFNHIQIECQQSINILNIVILFCICTLSLKCTCKFIKKYIFYFLSGNYIPPHLRNNDALKNGMLCRITLPYGE